MKKSLIVFTLVILIIITGFLMLNKNMVTEPESIDLESSQNRLKENIENMINIEDHIEEIADKYGLDLAEYQIESIDYMDYYAEKKGVVEFLFASLVMNDSELFLQAFDMGSISSDLFAVEQANKDEVIKTMMDKITRNNTLQSINYLDENSNTNHATVNIIYEDGLTVTIPLQFEKIQQQQSTLYSISTSVWDMIDIIEKSTN